MAGEYSPGPGPAFMAADGEVWNQMPSRTTEPVAYLCVKETMTTDHNTSLLSRWHRAAEIFW